MLGLAYPLVRGRTGLGKGLAVFVSTAVPSVCATLLPDPAAPGVIAASLLQAAQWLSFGLIVGLAGDLRQLRLAGLGWRGLADVHNLTAITASLSSTALALVTAAATALGTSAAAIALDTLVPKSSPPAVTSAPK